MFKRELKKRSHCKVSMSKSFSMPFTSAHTTSTIPHYLDTQSLQITTSFLSFGPLFPSDNYVNPLGPKSKRTEQELTAVSNENIILLICRQTLSAC